MADGVGSARAAEEGGLAVADCLYCGKELPKGRRKYCSDNHRYRYHSMQNDRPAKFSVAQHLRMARAGRKQRAGKIGVRFN